VVAPPRSVSQGKPELKRPEDVPQEKPAEIKKKPAKGTEPRALGLLQLSSGKATLIPIVIRIDGRFYDASVYKADPVPMALESGTVYEAEQAGDSQGLFTVGGALHSKTAGSANPWVGTGTYLARGAEAASATHKAENVPVGLDNSDEPPRLTRGDSSKAAGAASTGSTAEAPTSNAPRSNAQTTASGGAGASDKTGTKDAGAQASAAPAGTPAGTSSGQKTTEGNAGSATDKPADAKGQATGSAQKSSDGTAAQATSGQSPTADGSKEQSSENYYRPALRRGKPTEKAPEEPESEVKTVKSENKNAASASSAEPVQLVPAVSDAAGPDPKSYKFFWKTGEEQERRDQMLALAGDEVRAYERALVKNQIPAKPVATKANTGRRKLATKPEQPVFENLQFKTFDVWMNNQPVMILTAEAHFPGMAAVAAAGEQSYSIALVAKTDIYGNLHKLYSGVTDKFHLDVTPKLELIDVVDVDGDGRGELLFHETTDAGSGYVIYRATADKLWKMFDNLNAE
jgi:hypothetical protein